MKVEQKLIPVGHPNRPGHKLGKIMALVFHYTGNDAKNMNAEANIKYMGRGYIRGESGKVYEMDGKTLFRAGSAHIFCDIHKVVQAIPLDEVAWSVGDARLPWSDLNKGQQSIARNVFSNRQNYNSISIEICNNDEIKNSTADWDGAVSMAREWAIDYCKAGKLAIDEAGSLDPQHVLSPPVPGRILLLRHYDLTGKRCPEPFIADQAAWVDFVKSICKEKEIKHVG